MSTDGVTAGGGGSTICTMAMLVCVCPRVSVCVYQCASMSVCIQLRLVLNAGLTLAHSFLPPSHPTQDSTISTPQASFVSITDADSQVQVAREGD